MALGKGTVFRPSLFCELIWDRLASEKTDNLPGSQCVGFGNLVKMRKTTYGKNFPHPILYIEKIVELFGFGVVAAYRNNM